MSLPSRPPQVLPGSGRPEYPLVDDRQRAPELVARRRGDLLQAAAAEHDLHAAVVHRDGLSKSAVRFSSASFARRKASSARSLSDIKFAWSIAGAASAANEPRSAITSWEKRPPRGWP
jgi:hypothetical protein